MFATRRVWRRTGTIAGTSLPLTLLLVRYAPRAAANGTLMRILVINGPNLNLLGTRRPEVYGTTTLAELEVDLIDFAEQRGARVVCFQSNHEGALIDALHQAIGRHDGVVVNFGAYSHTSRALQDAIEAIELPTVEVHISNIYEREEWRATSFTAQACVHSIVGEGIAGYAQAVEYLLANHAP